MLLTSGADMNAVDTEGNSALMLATICEHEVRTVRTIERTFLFMFFIRFFIFIFYF